MQASSTTDTNSNSSYFAFDFELVFNPESSFYYFLLVFKPFKTARTEQDCGSLLCSLGQKIALSMCRDTGNGLNCSTEKEQQIWEGRNNFLFYYSFRPKQTSPRMSASSAEGEGRKLFFFEFVTTTRNG